ncbi:hypothetical protein BD779DRAFT_1797777 [Infundibulicybe gibba]|nr:hypothetical protein BD779DRAFT_1797777 [Infundibulicybe gibba]
MKFTSALTILFTIFFTFAVAFPITKRDVFVPPITSPENGDAWVVGQTVQVTWDTSNAPTQITNPKGKIYLRKAEMTLLNVVLAEGFDILLGAINVTVPAVAPDSDYRVVLMGDSGNFSPFFSISSAV